MNKWIDPKDTQQLQNQMYEFQLNQSVVTQYVEALIDLDSLEYNVELSLKRVASYMERFFRYLSQRHINDGEKIHRDPIITDVALNVFANIDAHGEIEAGNDEISAYSANKALLVAGAVKEGFLAEFIREPDKFQDFIQTNIGVLRQCIATLKGLFGREVEEVMKIAHISPVQRLKSTTDDIVGVIQEIQDLNPASIRSKEDEVFLNQTDRYNQKFRDETLQTLVDMLIDKNKIPKDIMDYVLSRKGNLRKHFQEENSFYVCKIGAGNAFIGKAPGELEVVPGNRPNVTIDDIKGSGFPEVRDFLGSIDAAAQWHDLFIATSPSKKVDKNNILLIGPMGSGKSEVMRAVASEPKSIAIYAQGSDFLTCWKGEAEKNPKRLFEAAIKLRKESKKHVHILIDEVDAVMNDDRSINSTNLTLEFQLLMDGVVSYPGLSVWGATNSPERIPMPMIRRFSKVLIVGELSPEHTIELLKLYVGYLPIDGIKKAEWMSAAKKLDGATGDVVRKIADHLWRTKMASFVHDQKDDAVQLVDFLNQNDKFDIAEFDDKTRTNFKTRLGKHVRVTASDLNEAIDVHLKNVAIHAEIETAVATYERAKRFLAQIEAGDARSSNIIVLDGQNVIRVPMVVYPEGPLLP
jgi:hypothetical protein